MKAQQKKLSGCASNSLAHEDLGHFQEAHHWNIQAKFYNEKFPLVYESDNIGDSIMKTMVLLWSTSVVKRILALSLLSFSLIFLFGLSLFFIWPSSFFKVRSLIPTCGGIIVSIILSSLGQCSNNEDHHTFIYLQLKITTQYLEQDMTLYECLRWCTGICNESRVRCK